MRSAVGGRKVQVTRWRDLPSMVAARADDETVKSELAPRFQEAIEEFDEALGLSPDLVPFTPWMSREAAGPLRETESALSSQQQQQHHDQQQQQQQHQR